MNNSEGLPNIGNTCFLNSVLQGLYSVQYFRNQIQSQKAMKETMSYHLQKVFNAIRYQMSKKEKIEILQNLIQYLLKQKSEYQGLSQQDASSFLLQIINKLGEQNQKYLRYFQFDTQLKCNGNFCFIRYLIENQIFFSARQINCSNPKCFNGSVSTIFKRAPLIMIVSDQSSLVQEFALYKIKSQFSQSQSQNQKLYLPNIMKKNSKNQNYQYATKIKYQLKSVILYRGNKSHGHYVCLRASDQLNKKYKLINDFWVSQENYLAQFKMSNFLPLIFIYQRKNLNPKISCSVYSNFDQSETLQKYTQCQKFKQLFYQQRSPQNQFQNTCEKKLKRLYLNQMAYEYHQESILKKQCENKSFSLCNRAHKIFYCSLI